MLAMPVMMIMGFLPSLFSGQTSSLCTGIPMVLGSIVMGVAALGQVFGGRQDYARQKAAFEERLKEMRKDLQVAHETQRFYYRHTFPDLSTIFAVAARDENSRFGLRLWERRPSDGDFGALRLGIGSRPSSVIYRVQQGDEGNDEDGLWKAAKQLEADSFVLTDAPITLALRPPAAPDPKANSSGPKGTDDQPEAKEMKKMEGGVGTPRQHAVGLVGRNAGITSDFARAALMNFLAVHSPNDVRLWVLGTPEAAKNWQWATWLPHCNLREDGEGEEQLCFTAKGVPAFWKKVKAELDARQVRLRDSDDKNKGGMDVTLPMLVVVVDLLGDIPRDSPLAEVAMEATAYTLTENGPTLGAAVVFLATDKSRLPSDCGAVVEVESIGTEVVFRYAETGLNSFRYIGKADLVNDQRAKQEFAREIRRLAVRRGPGADLPRAVTLIEMNELVLARRLDKIEKFTLGQNWQDSIVPANSEWMRVPMGMVGASKVRSLLFSATADGDGVHGMVAGTTGSGKSELLQTLIVGLAIKYDPRIINFVLVDFKGGAAFDVFKRLPHCVDLVTNLQGNAVDRMFVAIKSELDRRSALLAESGAKDVVRYRRDVAPRLQPGDRLPKTFPHLFVIVDEFAEMIVQNPEYKAQFESIARLGRAIGVSLILATQRPAGMVTDQMRANMKFRICLRVETPDDSKELLKSPEAAFLPSIAGRGYMQIGNDVLEQIQVAYAGGDYDNQEEALADVIWLDEKDAQSGPALSMANLAAAAKEQYSSREIAEALGTRDENLKLVDWLVGMAVIRAKADGVPVQTKPWPDPLPNLLSLNQPVNATYINSARKEGPTLVINPAVAGWADNADENNLWQTVDPNSSLKVELGLIDNPYQAEQRLLTIDLTRDPLVIFGSSGYGKTAFLCTLMTSLAATRSPAQLHMYVLDFGRGGLNAMKALPHLGAAVDTSQESLVEQMMRTLRNMIDERQERAALYKSLAEYNTKNPDTAFPAVIILIDNFAEFKENFERLIPDLISLVRDGRAFGLYFVVTASNPADVSGKLFNLFTQRVTLTLPDPSLYSDIVGRGGLNFNAVAGRGLIPVDRQPLEFQVAVPTLPVTEGATLSVADQFEQVARRMDRVWRKMGGERPSAELPRDAPFMQMMSLVLGRPIESVMDMDLPNTWAESMVPAKSEWLRSPLGLIGTRKVRRLTLSAASDGDGVHGMVAGTTGSGKSEMLQTLIAGLAIKYDPRIVNFVLVDFKGGAAFDVFKHLPHCVDVVTNLQGNAVERMFIAIKAELDRRSALLAQSGAKDIVKYRMEVAPKLGPDDVLPKTFPHLFVVVDEFAEMVVTNPEFKAQFESIARLGRAIGVTLILATQRPAGMVTDQMRANMKFRVCLRVETAEDSRELLKRAEASSLPPIPGRGYVQTSGDSLQEIQVAYAGKSYSPTEAEAAMYKADDIAEMSGGREDNLKLIDWIVGTAALHAKQAGIPKQTKPWPDPLPEVLPLNHPLDAQYVAAARAAGFKTIMLNPTLAAWLANEAEDSLWKPVDWETPLQVHVGLVDNPYQAEQFPLTLDLSRDPLVVFGGSGWGKTTFIRSVIYSLAATRSPAQFNVYVLDFGRGGLKGLRFLPHLGVSIDGSQESLVQQMLRTLRNMITERQERTAAFKSLADYNAHNPDKAYPSVLVIIDNFAEFKENFEPLLPDLLTLVRDGRAFGLSYIVTASNTQDLSGKLYNLFAQRLVLTMPDPAMVPDIVGRGAPKFSAVPGRGALAINRTPLEFQIGLPLRLASGHKDVNAARADAADMFELIAKRMDRAWRKVGGERPSAELPKGSLMLDMEALVDGHPIRTVEDLRMRQKWTDSLVPKKSEWLRAPLGLIGANKVRSLVFSMATDGDGVHGMVAGTTGSGKSELLQTLVAALAIKYDPRIINFVLVDFKGGAAFESFRYLPHCVDIVTNLQGNAVDRMFVAIKSELDRRSALLAKSGAKDIVKYRQEVAPKVRPEDDLPTTFPHLFVIVDEFAEMMTANPDFKLQFESIARLGRAIGVTLILATQRPAGMVTDQMRSNMKFRVCLRVETADDSKEMLRRAEASTLPPIPGRGYVQVGTESLQEIQVAYAGASYEKIPNATPGVDEDYTAAEIAEAVHMREDNLKLIDWIVGAAAIRAKKDKVPQQIKPWPDPLPNHLPLNLSLDARYLDSDRKENNRVVINPAVAEWMANTADAFIWKPQAWEESLQVDMGLVDNPVLARQTILTLNLPQDPVVLFGTSGRGKSVFISSLLLALAARRSPADLHMYLLDFGRGGLNAIKGLPHVGGTVDSAEEERVNRALRMVRNMIDQRQTKVAAYRSLGDYNTQNPDDAFPAVVVAIDNFADFKENYEDLIPDLISLIRDGRPFGIYFIITSNQLNYVSGKLFNLMTQRLTLTLPDAGDYMEIVGRGSPKFNNVPGRGLLAVDRTPLEFQVATPIVSAETADFDPGEQFVMLATRMRHAWETQPEAVRRKGPEPVEPLAATISLRAMQPPVGIGLGKLVVPVGITDLNRKPTLIDLKGKGPHLMLAGPPLTGMTTTMRALVLSLANSYSPEELGLVFVDPSAPGRRFFNYGGKKSLSDLPHVLATVTEKSEIDDLLGRMQVEYDDNFIARVKKKSDSFRDPEKPRPAIVVFMDHYDDVDSICDADKLKRFGTLALRYASSHDLHFVLSGSLNLTRQRDDLLRHIEAVRYAIIMQDYDTVRSMGAQGAHAKGELPPGRGYLIKAVKATLMQVAAPHLDGNTSVLPEQYLDDWVTEICDAYTGLKPEWNFKGDVSALKEVMKDIEDEEKAARGW
jgi:DNA segregation ATPase FtsK/SpoIIIE, S-DNA-T family